MSKSVITDALLTGIADAIREKTGGEASLTPAEMITEIESIEVGSGGSTTPEELAELLTHKTLSSTKYPEIVPLVDFGPVTDIPRYYFSYVGGTKRAHGFGVDSNVEKIICPNIKLLEEGAMEGNYYQDMSARYALREAYFPVCETFRTSSCACWFFLRTLKIDSAVTIEGAAFLEAGEDLYPADGKLYINASVQTIGSRAFSNSGFGDVYFTGTGTPQSIESDAFAYGGIQNIYVPWSVNDVAGAPWGATTANIHFEHVTPAEGE